MKKKILITSSCLAGALLLTGCNKSIIDTTYKFDRAVLTMPDGTVVCGEVESWKDYDDGDQIQVKIDGDTYLVHSSNIVLFSEGSE